MTSGVVWDGGVVSTTGIGGTDGGCPQEAWGGNGGTGFERIPDGPVACERRGNAMADRAAGGVAVLFGGHDGDYRRQDTWEWDGSNWTLRTSATSPSRRRASSMFFDPKLGKMWMQKLARHPNVYVKMSAFKNYGDRRAPYRDLIPLVQFTVDAFGPERLMWGSDNPYQLMNGNNYPDCVALIREQVDSLSKSERIQIMRGTAEQLLF